MPPMKRIFGFAAVALTCLASPSSAQSNKGGISGTVFDDRDGDGIRDADEPGVGGVLVLRDPLFRAQRAQIAALAAKSRSVIRRNAAMLPAYSVLLGLIALFSAIVEGASGDWSALFSVP